MSVENKTWTINDFIECLPFYNAFTIKILCLINVPTFVAGFILYVNVLIAPELQCEWKLTTFEISLISIAFYIGEGCGSFYWGRTADIYGRKVILIVVTACMIYFALLSSVSDSFASHMMMRFFVGAGYNGCFIMTTVYSTEFTKKADHCKAILFVSIVFIVGNLAAIGVSYFTMNSYGWRNFILWSMLPCLLLVFLMVLLPESIRFLTVNGENNQVFEMLNDIAATNNVSWPENIQFQEISKSKNIINNQSPGYVEVMTKHWKKLLGLSMYGIPLFLSYYGIPFFIDYKLQQQSSCQFNRTQTIVQCAPLSDSQIVRSFLVNLGMLPGTICGYILAEKFGRKILLGFTMILMSICYFIQLFCVPSIITYILLFLASGFGTSSTVFIMLFSSELFPTNIRSTATGMAATLWKVFSIISPLLFQHLIYTNWTLVIVLMGMSSLIGIVGLCILPETLGQNLKDY